MTQLGKISQFTLLIGAAILLILGLYGMLYLYPAHRSLEYIQKQITNETVNLDRLKILFPVQARAKALERIRFNGRLPLPERVEMPRKALTSLPDRFSAAARKHGMNLLSSDFDINGMDEESKNFSFTVELTGKLKNFRQFLIDLITHASFNAVEVLEIRAGKGDAKSITLTLNIRIEKAGT